MKTMTPSTPAVSPETKTTTAGQIDKAVRIYRDLLEKHSAEFDSETVQLVLGQPELADEQFQLFRKRVEAQSKTWTRRVYDVDRTRAPQQVLDDTGRKQYTDKGDVSTMPRGEGKEKEVKFFELDLSERGGYISDDDLEKEYALRGLKPVDPYSLAKVNQDDEALADTKPNCTHWKDADGNWCYAAFDRWDVAGRSVVVYRSVRGWSARWSFGGVAIESSKL